MYKDLINKLRELPHLLFVQLGEHEDVVYQAADAIEKLDMKLQGANAAIAGMQREIERMVIDSANSKPQWIPMAERLPEEGKFVLVYGDLYPNKHDGGVIAVSKRMDWNYWQGFGRERDITHWMPLPEPPKEGE